MGGVLARCQCAVMAADTPTADAGVIKPCRNPRTGGVTDIALLRRRNMSRRFAGGRRAVVTTRTCSNNLRVIYPQHRHPGRAAVTRIAQIGGRDMGCRLAHRQSAGTSGTAMTADAGSDDLGVIDPDHGDKCRGIVAGLTNIARVVVGRPFSGCLRAIVTTEAIANDPSVIEACTQPRRSRMARIARLSCRRMRSGFACGDRPVMAALTSALYLSVVYARRRSPGRNAVAGLTNGRSGDMSRRLPGGRGPIVTARTHAGDLSMIDARHGNPGREGVAGFAHVAAANVGRRFASRLCPVMTAETIPGHAGMIKQRPQPARGRMAGVAFRRCRHMVGGFA